MLFVTLMKGKPESSIRGRMQRRLDWQYPEGMKPVAEYWLTSNEPAVIVIAEADDPVVMFHAMSLWDDVFDITVTPVITAEQGIAHARRELAAARA